MWLEFSWKFYVMSCHKSTTVWFILPIWYWHQILRLYHVISRGFFHVKTWHGFWTSSSHGISMAFARKMMGFSSDLVSLRPKYHQNDMNKSQSHFILLSFSFQFRSWYFKFQVAYVSVFSQCGIVFKNGTFVFHNSDKTELDFVVWNWSCQCI